MLIQKFFAPAISLMNRLDYARKFIVLGSITLLATGIVAFNLYNALNKSIQSARMELEGLSPVISVNRSIQLVQQHRGRSAGVLGGEKSMAQPRAQKEQEVDLAMNALSGQLPAELRQGKEFREIQRSWAQLRQNGMRQTLEANFGAHTGLINKLLEFGTDVADYYKLTTDPDISTHYLLEDTIHNLPRITEYIGRIRAYGTGILSSQSATTSQKVMMSTLLAQLENDLGPMRDHIGKTGRHNPAIKKAIASSFAEIELAAHALVRLTRANILEEKFSTSPEAYYTAATNTIDKIYWQTGHTLTPAARTLIQERIERLERVLRAGAAVMLAMFAIVLYFAVGGYIAVSSSIQTLVQAARDFAQGDWRQRISPAGRDEIAQIGHSFNQMADGFAALLAARQEDGARLRLIIESSLEAIVRINADGVITGWNLQAEKTLGWKASEVLGQPLHEYVIPQRYREAHIRGMQHFLATGEGPVLNRRIEIVALRRDGQEIPVELTIAPNNHSGKYEFSAFIRDISERKQHEEKQVLAARVFNEAQEGIIVTDHSGRMIVDVNPAFSQITGYGREEVLGKNPNILSSGRHDKAFYQGMWDSLNQHGHWRGEIWNRRKSGELYAELLTISALRGENGEILHYVGLFSDITQSKNQQEALEIMAHYDPLTRLPNRTLFSDRFNQAIARCKREESLLAICYLDLDGFKQVNDSKGHETGDQLLIQVAERIKSNLREEDTVSRLGGDEFALLLGSLSSLEQCELAVSRINHSLSIPYAIDGEKVIVSASIGATLYPLDDADPDTLLRHADQAMYQAKQEGRNCYHLFDATHDQEVQSRRQLLSTLEEAFSRGEFCLYYQPKVNMMTGDVIGAEALIRWDNPQRGIMLPHEFLSVVEGSHFDIIMGNWIIDEAMQQLDTWRKQGLLIKISLNISPKHLQWEYFIQQLEAVMAQYPEVDSSQLEIEVLESSVLEDFNAVKEVINACRKRLGISIALDDFGTGYSSLVHLRHIPADMIKIDQSFVRHMIDDPNDFAIVNGVIGMSRAFRRDVIAEGVETVEHGLVLLSMGCDLAQGYSIARPMPARQMESWFRDYVPCVEWASYAAQPLTRQEADLLLLKIESRQWLQRLEDCLLSMPGDKPHWPIMDHRKCHCGRWIELARTEKLYADTELDILEQAHEALHSIGNRLMEQHLSGDIETARAGIPELKKLYATMEQFIRQHLA